MLQGAMGYNPVAKEAAALRAHQDMITLDLDSETIEQIRKDITDKCILKFTFPEYLPALSFKLFDPSDSEGRIEWLSTLDNSLRVRTCTDCEGGMLLAYPLMDGPVARNMFLSILADSEDETARPYYSCSFFFLYSLSP